ncbi:MAG: hypothetical protein ACKO92_07805, partial [Actinomycetota bacterium]
MNATVLGLKPPRDNLNRFIAAKRQSANKPENKYGNDGLRLVKNGTRYEEAASIFRFVDKYATDTPKKRLAITKTLDSGVLSARTIE